MIKMIACDIDGTSIRSDHTMSERVRKAILSAVEKGCIFAFATGRMFISAKKFSDVLDIEHPIIACNGALIEMSKSEEILSIHSLDHDLHKKAVDLMWDVKIPFQAYYSDRVLVPEYSPYTQWYTTVFGVNCDVTDDIDVLKEKPAIKLMAIEPSERLIAVRDALNKECPTGLNLTLSGDNLLDITRSEISKGHAIEFLANKLGVDLSEVMAIGDAGNDVEMLQTVGYPVAMGNSCEDLKKIAKIVVSTNEEDGVAEAIEKYVLGEGF